MFSKIYSGAICGALGRLIGVEADISDGFPSYTLVGYLASEVKEARERVTTALKNSGYYLPAKKIIVNLSPADLRKQGTAYDLPIALTILCALGVLYQKHLDGLFAIGELSLNGNLRPVKGILPLVMCARDQGLTTCLVPAENVKEASLVDGVEVIGLTDIKSACLYFTQGTAAYERYMAGKTGTGSLPAANGHLAEHPALLDFADVYGQEGLKRAFVVAAAGMHHMLMIGPPGSGKSMCARRIPGILPAMTKEECLEVSRLYSVVGSFSGVRGLMDWRPFRDPHHTVSVKAMTGGGAIPAPGEISLAHRGVLFLDELAEFAPATLEVLRQPLEEGVIKINRLHGSFVFPARFMLVAATNPCKCGFFPNREKCHCTPGDVYRYFHRISQPILDRIDLCVDVHPPELDQFPSGDEGGDIFNKKKSVLSSVQMRQMVEGARQIQQQRFGQLSVLFNGEMTSAMVEQFCALAKPLRSYLNELSQQLDLSARGRHKLLKVARTIADLDGKEQILETHLSEAACYRMIDRAYWDF